MQHKNKRFKARSYANKVAVPNAILSVFTQPAIILFIFHSKVFRCQVRSVPMKVPDEFDVEKHYNKLIPRKSGIPPNSHIILSNRLLTKSRRETLCKMKREIKAFTYEQFKDASLLFSDSLMIRGSARHLMPHLHKADLTGGMISIGGRSNGIIVDERTNSFTVIFPGDLVKVYPKATNDFVLHLDGNRYLFYGTKLNLNRLLKK